MSLHVRTGDTVIVLSGRDKGRTGKVLQAMPSEGKVIVEKVAGGNSLFGVLHIRCRFYKSYPGRVYLRAECPCLLVCKNPCIVVTFNVCDI